MLTEPEREQLLRAARLAIERSLTLTPREEPGRMENRAPALCEPRGVFVTIHVGRALRGCVGYVLPVQPLIEAVEELAVKAASCDPRFPPVRASEVDALDISISVLSPIRPITSIDEIILGTHGLIMQTPFTKGLLLPKVPVEHGWTRERFLDETALKAGLPREAWKIPGVRLSVFTTEDFSEQRKHAAASAK